MNWITAPSTEPDDWRKRGQRIARQSLADAYPDGPPLGLTFQRMVDGARRYCLEKGWPPPSDRTYQRAINGT